MSHFTVLVVLPKNGIEKYPNSETDRDDSYIHQWYHPELEYTLAPYNEQPEVDSEYLERAEDYCEAGTKVYQAYINKEWDKLSAEFNEALTEREKWSRDNLFYDNDKQERRMRTEIEIQKELQPLRNLFELMQTEQFDITNEEHLELFTRWFCDSSEIDVEKNGEIYNVWWSNPYAKWDWWVVGGRWREMGDNGYFSDLSVFLEEETLPYWKAELGWWKMQEIHKDLGLTEDKMKELGHNAVEEMIIDFMKKPNTVVKYWDTSNGTGDKAVPKEYYTPEELFTPVTRKVVETFSYLFPDEGWIEAGEMGWFGMSSLDSKDIDEVEQIKKDTYALTDNLIKKYKDTHIGLVVDCHI